MINALLLIGKAIGSALLFLLALATYILPFIDEDPPDEEVEKGMAARPETDTVTLPDEVPMPADVGRETIDIDTLWNRRN